MGKGLMQPGWQVVSSLIRFPGDGLIVESIKVYMADKVIIGGSISIFLLALFPSSSS